MPHNNWRDAVWNIGEATGKITRRQQQLATLAGAELPEHLPRIVAAARLQAMLGTELDLPSTDPCTDMQLEIIAGLETDDRKAVPAPEDSREANAWIRFLRLKQRLEALQSLQVIAGDVVQSRGAADSQPEEVSSIGSDGRIYFKGGAGAGAWPDMVFVRCRKDDNSPAACRLKKVAANQAAHRLRTNSWSKAKQLQLQEFEVTTPLTFNVVEQFATVLDSASDEKPIQVFIETHPEILTGLLVGVCRFCLPRQSLGGKFVPDFVISDVNSMGSCRA